MDKVTILSRKRFLEYVPTVPTEEVVAIRIGDKPPLRDTASKRYADTLSLSFYDVWEFADDINRNTPDGSNRMTEKEKVRVDEFIEAHAKKNFVLHCEQGISRSSAVGYYLLKKLGYTKELNEKKESSLFQPNIEVYGVLTGKPYRKETASELMAELKSIEQEY